MQNVFCAPGAPIEVPAAREIVRNINRLAQATRRAGGLVVWVQMTVSGEKEWPIFLGSIVSPRVSRSIAMALRPGSEGHRLWHEMLPETDDIFVQKNRFSAFLPQACPLAAMLSERGIDTVLVAGTLTNVCCESSARDAMMMNFKTIMVADANATRSDEEHLATLITFAQVFGDVRSVDEVVEMLARDTSVSTAAE
jgi:ureidoacrylate peracid hydrolase